MLRIFLNLSIVIGIGIAALLIYGADERARDEGFDGVLDRAAAENLGLGPNDWKAKKADEQRESEARRRQQQRQSELYSLQISACVRAEFAIKERLKAPSSAKFAPCYEYSITGDSASGFEVRGHVEAQNSFGVMLRSRFIVRLRHLGADAWEVITADLI